jgi:predicted methyltransferase
MPKTCFPRVTTLVPLCCLATTLSVPAQTRPEEASREGWQRVDEILAALDIRPGATVADVGAGDGFFTTRLARAVGPDGRVFAVDIDDGALGRLRKRLDEDGIRNVYVVKGTAADPKLPERALDAALIVNAYHEMPQHQDILAALRRALKPAGRLVIVEPITDARRGRSRADQEHDHEIAPEFALGDARAAGFRIAGLQDPFTRRGGDLEWLLVLQPADQLPAPTPGSDGLSATAAAAAEQKDPALRIPTDEFLKLVAARRVTIVDVRDDESFANGHIPGAISIPLASVEGAIERLRGLANPVVTYCS